MRLVVVTRVGMVARAGRGGEKGGGSSRDAGNRVLVGFQQGHMHMRRDRMVVQPFARGWICRRLGTGVCVVSSW